MCRRPPVRFTVFVNGGVQIGDNDINRVSTFRLYEEEARIEFSQTDIGGGGFFDFGGSWRFRERLGAGASYSYIGSSGDGTVVGSIPHPLVFDPFRPIEASASDLEHNEHGFHLFATWHMPLTEKVELTFSGGPSFFNISQDFIRTRDLQRNPALRLGHG